MTSIFTNDKLWYLKFYIHLFNQAVLYMSLKSNNFFKHVQMYAKTHFRRTCYFVVRKHFFYRRKFLQSPTSGEDEFIKHTVTQIQPNREFNIYRSSISYKVGTTMYTVLSQYREFKTNVDRSLSVCPTAKCIYILYGIYQIFKQLQRRNLQYILLNQVNMEISYRKSNNTEKKTTWNKVMSSKRLISSVHPMKIYIHCQKENDMFQVQYSYKTTPCFT